VSANRHDVRVLGALLLVASIAACSVFKPSTPEEVNEFEYAGYPDSADRRHCVRQAEAALELRGPSGDMYYQTRRTMRLELIGQCMRQRGHAPAAVTR
jgi:hypothetical protein